jgi:hypothetical protein
LMPSFFQRSSLSLCFFTCIVSESDIKELGELNIVNVFESKTFRTDI